MTIEKVIRARKALSNISHDTMPVRAAYKLSKLSAAFESDEQFYAERLKEIVGDYCKRDESGEPVVSEGGYAIREDKISECSQSIAELRALEVKCPDIKIRLSELDSSSLSIEDISALYDFIEED